MVTPTPTPLPPVPMHLATVAARHADDWGVLLFLLAAALAGVTGYRWLRASEGHREDDDCEGNAVWIDESTILD